MLSTTKGKKAALAALAERRSHQPERIDNSALVAGAPMYYYCICCGWLADTLPECHIFPPRKLCRECQALKDMGWLEE